MIKGRLGSTVDAYTLTVKPDELPRDEKIPEKCNVLFDRRFVWESIGQVELCCRCYSAALRQITKDEQEKLVIEAFKTKAVKTLLVTLQHGKLE